MLHLKLTASFNYQQKIRGGRGGAPRPYLSFIFQLIKADRLLNQSHFKFSVKLELINPTIEGASKLRRCEALKRTVNLIEKHRCEATNGILLVVLLCLIKH